MRVVDESVLDLFRGRMKCGICLRSRDCEPHHSTCKGMGGGRRLDVRFLLLGVCRECHTKIHAGKITREEVLAMISDRETMPVEDIVLQKDLFLRAPKECGLCHRCGGRGKYSLLGKVFLACGVCLGSGIIDQNGEPWEPTS